MDYDSEEARELALKLYTCSCESCCTQAAIYSDTKKLDKPEAVKSKSNDGLCGRTKPEARTEILDRMKYFYMQTDETYKWPNSAEGDLLKMVHGLLNT